MPTGLEPASSARQKVGWYATAARQWAGEALDVILPALVVALALLFLAQPRRLEGPSMEPNLHEGQRLFIEKISYIFHPPRRGDIVVLRLPEQNPDSLIKRVIGLPGETIEIRDGQVLIDGRILEEPYRHAQSHETMAPRVVPADVIFVLGDNRRFSNDSRAFGPVPLAAIEGRAWFRYWPPDKIGRIR